MATASQEMTLIRFFDLIRGARMPAPTKLVPVVQIPNAAPATEMAIAKAKPTYPHMYGSMPGVVSYRQAG